MESTVKGNGMQVHPNYIQTEEKTKAQRCFDEVQPILEKYKCQIICIPQKMYGQTVYVPMIEEIK